MHALPLAGSSGAAHRMHFHTHVHTGGAPLLSLLRAGHTHTRARAHSAQHAACYLMVAVYIGTSTGMPSAGCWRAAGVGVAR